MAKPMRILTDEEIADCEKYAQVGCNLNQIAGLLDCSPTCLDEIIARDERVKRAIEKGRSSGISKVAATAYQMAVTGNVPAMTMFFLKTRAGWREQAHEKEDDDKPIELNYKK